MKGKWIPESDWKTIVDNVPIVSIDLLVRHDGDILFGKRRNEPAKGFWFVPGGRVHKGEQRITAVERIADRELSIEVEIVERIGSYKHIYETAEIPETDGKHYLATGYVVDWMDGNVSSDDQHESLRFFHSPPEPFHDYIEQYLRDAKSLPEWP